MNHKSLVLSQFVNLHRKRSCARVTLLNVGTTFVAVLIILMLSGCSQESGQRPGAIPRTKTVSLPTSAPTPKPSPVGTRVMPIEVLTPPPTSTITPIPDEVLGLVVDVIDGSTIVVVMDGDPLSRAYEVRYIGLDAATNSSPNPWDVVAYETNQKITSLKVVKLVRDTTDFDAEGYLLRYVYVNNQMLNIILTEQGLVRADVGEPNSRFNKEILEAEARAKEGKLGLWGQATPTPTSARGEVAVTEETGVATPVITRSITATVTITGTAEPIKKTLTAPSPITGTVESTAEGTVEPTIEGTLESDLQGP